MEGSGSSVSLLGLGFCSLFFEGFRVSFLGGRLRALDVYSLGVGFGPLDWHSVLGEELRGLPLYIGVGFGLSGFCSI